MTTLNEANIYDEIGNVLKNSNIFTVAVRGVTTATDNFTATAGQTQFTLTHAGVRNIRSVTVQSVSKNIIQDYNVDWSTGIVTLVASATLSDAVAIQYDYGTSDKIFPDFPRDDLTLTSYPRVGFGIISGTVVPYGLGGKTHMTEFMIDVICIVPANKDSTIASGFGGFYDLMSLTKNIRDAIRTNCKSFYTFPYITPISEGPVLPGRDGKLLQKNLGYLIKWKLEAD